MSVLEQIKVKPKMHASLFACWLWGFISAFSGGDWEAFVAAGFVISALISGE